MAVYVDAALRAKAGKFWCHLFADSTEELHAFAKRIGLKRCWFETSNNGLPHYDIHSFQIVEAISAGAIETDQWGAIYHLAKLDWDSDKIGQIMARRRRMHGFEYEYTAHDHKHPRQAPRGNSRARP